MTKLYIAVDFDGTIVKNKWPEIGPFRFGARAVLKWLKKRGHVLILNTCREDKPFDAMATYCPGCNIYLLTEAQCVLERGEEICFDYYNENSPELIAQFGGDCRKISADWYIDDLAGFLGWWSIPIIILWLEWRKGWKG